MRRVGRLIVTLAIVAAIVVAGVALWVRVAPLDPVAFHAEPLAAGAGNSQWLVRPEGGDAAAPVFPDDPVSLMARVEALALAEPRTTVLAGRPEDAWMTFVQRSLLMGYPDIVSVRAIPAEGGSTLAIWSRSRYGDYDWGVNRTRVERWLAALQAGG